MCVCVCSCDPAHHNLREKERERNPLSPICYSRTPTTWLGTCAIVPSFHPLPPPPSLVLLLFSDGPHFLFYLNLHTQTGRHTHYTQSYPIYTKLLWDGSSGSAGLMARWAISLSFTYHHHQVYHPSLYIFLIHLGSGSGLLWPESGRLSLSLRPLPPSSYLLLTGWQGIKGPSDLHFRHSS